MNNREDVPWFASDFIAQMPITSCWTSRLASAAAVAILASAAVSVSSCAHASGPVASPPSNVDRTQAYSAAISELRDYLAVWRVRGESAASQQFLVPAERAGGVSLRLRSGKVVSYKPYRWVSSSRFTLFVTVDLHFIGSEGAWDVGRNDRFATFSRTASQGRYLIYFATGP
jgi:hypothetical protein